MDDFDPSDFQEAFLQANANEPFISSQFADFVRCLMRAVSSDEPSNGIYAASEKMVFVNELISRSSERLTWYGLISAAVAEIHSCMPDAPHHQKYVSAAKRGVKYLVESSATDNAAGGRAAKRLSEFQQAMLCATLSTRP